jgi:release factor glutamine methyltransferase
VSLGARLREARERLAAAGIDPAEAALDAELLARDILGWDRAVLLARSADDPPGGFDAAFALAVDRRAAREPMAYIRGRQEFWGREFAVGPGVLIPRPETELLVEEALAWGHEPGAPEHPVIVDVGTGSGCLAITLALELPHARVHATDVSGAALAAARANARALGAPVAFHHGSMLADVGDPVDLVVANPPYVSRDEHAHLPPEVRDHEPETALVGGADGLDAVRMVIVAASRALTPGGRLLMEVGWGQAPAAAALVAATGTLGLLRIRADLHGTPRALVAARRPAGPTSSG